MRQLARVARLEVRIHRGDRPARREERHRILERHPLPQQLGRDHLARDVHARRG